ncbi:septal ring lytic transglycosylase RlpA family protein [Halalkalibaculum sp. DA3122]|uniref:septal ring lytic transglycosylase RlpA family protein n=1 Tax=unclassified Halalkalibaculum TaxID=2964617 RepID=UPI00375409CA
MLQRPTFVLLALSLLVILSSCGITSRVTEPSRPAPGRMNKAIETGVASWYGPNFHGKMTANGEIYNMNAMTAAHRTLPFNTFVRVQNVDNDKSVVVRINDRGPFKDNRIIDLSRKAAREIEMIGPGTANVRLYVVEGDRQQIMNRDLKVSTYTVQVGSYEDESRAVDVSNEIEGTRIEQFTLNDGTSVYRVYYGIFTDKAKAEKEQQRLERRGYNGYVKQLENS